MHKQYTIYIYIYIHIYVCVRVCDCAMFMKLLCHCVILHSSRTTYDLPEEIFTGMLLLFGNICFVVIFMTLILEGGGSFTLEMAFYRYDSIVLMVIGAILALFSGGPYERTYAERSHSSKIREDSFYRLLGRD